MRVLVCGGRHFFDREFLARVLNHYHGCWGISCLIHGAAPGADFIAGKWAEEHGIAVERYPADWKTHGRAAGPIRNSEMLAKSKPDLVLAFPGGVGTADMTKKAQKAGTRVKRVWPESELD